MIRIVQYGCGKMSKYTMKYAIENGYEIVGAFDINPNIIGKDIGEVMNTNIVGIKIQDITNIKEDLKRLKPDICIVTTMSLLKDIEEISRICLEEGINVITTCEEAFYPFNSSPKISYELDKIAKENNCTITGSGYQDASWGNLISTLAGTSHNIKKIIGSSSYNVEDYGIALAQAHGAGKTLEEFDKEIASIDNISNEERKKLIENGDFLPSYMWNTNGWLCDKLNLTVKNQIQKCVPIICENDLISNTLNMTVKKGFVIGMRAVVITETEEDITIETECIGKIYSKDDFDCNNWKIIGEPNTNMVIERPQTVELTCAAIVNRIPDVINAQKGFIPTSKLGEIKYKRGV